MERRIEFGIIAKEILGNSLLFYPIQWLLVFLGPWIIGRKSFFRSDRWKLSSFK